MAYQVAGPRGRIEAPPGPVKISQRRPHIFHVSWPPYPTAGSATDIQDFFEKGATLEGANDLLPVSNNHMKMKNKQDCIPGGVSAPRGVPGRGGGIPACTEQTPPVDRITDACKNITLPQLRCGR